MKRTQAINDLLKVMAKLRSPTGCPWDREQDHMSLRWHAVEEVYELMDAIEARDDQEMEEELGDLLLQVVFHCQLAKERAAFDFDDVARNITRKLIRRHPHVFGKTKVKNVEQVWTNWEKIKRAEKHGTKHARASALDGIPKHLPALMRAEKLLKKARKANLLPTGRTRSTVSRPGRIQGRGGTRPSTLRFNKARIAPAIFGIVAYAQSRGWSVEDLLRAEINRQENRLRTTEETLDTRQNRDES